MSIKLISKAQHYRWRDVQFEHGRATVDTATFAQMKEDKYFGIDFWEAPVVPETVATETAPAKTGETTETPPSDGKTGKKK